MGWLDRLHRTAGTGPATGSRGLLTRLARDRAGNTLALMAAALIPILALTGSAVDTARLYVVKVRLQQACDAGVLAGRKTMDTSGSATLDSNATTQAKLFFANNFISGYMGTPAFTSATTPYPFTPTKTSDQQVAGTASVAVPMTLMKMFGQTTQTITVSCQARYDVADSDVMFVLDNTGSMACAPDESDYCSQPTVTYTRPDGTTDYKVQEKSTSRIVALRSAVLSFYDTVNSYADPTTHFRYGFVPYTSTVNVGYSLPSGSLVPQWQYQTRHVVGDHVQSTNSSSMVTVANAAACSAKYSRSPVLTVTTKGDGTQIVNYTYSTAGTASAVDPSWLGGGSRNCRLNNDTVTPIWRYQQWPLNVSAYITGATVTDPSKVDGTTAKWQGCIEERNTIVSMTFDQANLPNDLNPDLLPTASVDINGFPTTSDTRWRPMWASVLYNRNAATSVDDYGTSTSPYGDNGTYWNLQSTLGGYGYSPCPKPAQRLAVMSRSDVSNYLNASDFAPWGGTYHDTGMIWGTRMINPGGAFASDTAAWAGRAAPNRYIVFMTDGHMATNENIYGLWGWENYDLRTTGGDFANSDNYHNARLLAECTAAKNRNIKIYVVSVATAPDANLTACASPGSVFFATDSASLITAFQTIAKQVAMLRISQ